MENKKMKKLLLVTLISLFFMTFAFAQDTVPGTAEEIGLVDTLFEDNNGGVQVFKSKDANRQQTKEFINFLAKLGKRNADFVTAVMALAQKNAGFTNEEKTNALNFIGAGEDRYSYTFSIAISETENDLQELISAIKTLKGPSAFVFGIMLSKELAYGQCPAVQFSIDKLFENIAQMVGSYKTEILNGFKRLNSEQRTDVACRFLSYLGSRGNVDYEK